MLPVETDELLHALGQLREIAKHSDYRCVAVFAGDQTWSQDIARRLSEKESGACCWFGGGGELPANQHANQMRRVLGTEHDLVVINAYSGFDPDTLGAVSGTVRAGGLLLLITPNLDQWASFADPLYERITAAGYESDQIRGRYVQHLVRSIRNNPAVYLVEQGKPLASLPALTAPTFPAAKYLAPCRSDDQHAAVEAILHVSHGHRRRPLVITADRGRGKSAALGLAAAQLIKTGLRRIVVTAPRPAAAEQVFALAQQELPNAVLEKNRLCWEDTQLAFVAPDELVKSGQEADLVLVDEAAAIPAPLLEHILRHYSRVVFATTVHGYEGTGRGFALRFKSTLDQQTPGWRNITLSTPIRWAEGDPLEQWTREALLLDADPVAENVFDGFQYSALEFRQLERDLLLADEGLLRELFGLLVWAHYQTRPKDLLSLLDAPNISVYAACYRGHVAGAVLVATEGGFNEKLSSAIIRGQRRPRGHLVAQSLCFHAGFKEAAGLRYARVMRIAVHPAVQRRGIGTMMLERLETMWEGKGVDALATSFGATRELLDFWQRSHFLPVRLGFTRDQASGSHSVMLLRPLSAAGHTLCHDIHRRFCQSLPVWLRDALGDLDAGVINGLLSCITDNQTELEVKDWMDARAFVAGERGYESCQLGIYRMVLSAYRAGEFRFIPEKSASLLISKVLKCHSWLEIVTEYGVPGTKAAVQNLREGLAEVIKNSKFVS